jgi:hypothetical protein
MRGRRRWAVLLLLLLPAVSGLGMPPGIRPGAGPTLEGPPVVPPEHLVRVVLAGDYSEAEWSVEPEALADVEVAGDGRSLVFTGPPGVYRVTAFHVAWEEQQKGLVRGTFAIRDGGPRPDPGPDPDPGPVPPPPPPDPEPGPEPVEGPLHVFLLSDFDDLDPVMGEVRGSLIRDALLPLDAFWHSYDDDAAGEPERTWVAWWAAHDGGNDPVEPENLPVLLVVDKDRNVVLEIPSRRGTTPPASIRSEVGIVGLVKALRGID